MAHSIRLRLAQVHDIRRRLGGPRRLWGRTGAIRSQLLLATVGALAAAPLTLHGRRSEAAVFGGDTVVVYGPRQLAGSGGNGQTYVERFTATVLPSQTYTLRIDNGTPSGTNRSSKVTVTLNGFQVVSPTEVTQQIARLDKIVALTSVDTVRVTVGTAGSQVTVTVFGTPSRYYTVFGPRTFLKSTSSPIDSTIRFSSGIAGSGTIAGRLYVVNGASDGTHRVSSGSVSVNGQSFSVGSGIGSLSAPVSVNREPNCFPQVCLDANTIRVNISGSSGSTLAVRVMLPDSTRPVLTIAAPTPGAITNQTSLAVSGTVQDQTAVTVTVNGVPASITGTAYTATVPLPNEGNNTLTVVARDVPGLHTDSTRTVVRDTQAPSFTLSGPADGLVTSASSVPVSGTLADPSGTTVNVNGVPLVVQANGSFSGQAPLVEGMNVLTVTARDAATNSLSMARTVTRDSTPPLLSVTAPDEGASTNAGSVAVRGTVVDATTTTLTINGGGTALGAGGAFDATVELVEGPNTLTLLATDAAGNTATVLRHVTRNGATLPPDPATVAPPIDSTVATTVFDASRFLYTGANPIQTGVAAGTIEVRRAVLVRGRVVGRNDSPISGVTVSFQNHAELGQTLTRSDGRFDLVVNGGDQLTLDYRKAGYLEVQRTLPVEWNETVTAPDVVLVQVDPAVTTVDFSDPIEVARGSAMTDSSGTRQATLLFEQGTVATMRLPDGSIDTIPTPVIRATEYTVGATGPAAMPGTLPAASGYTYAVELTADQALSAGATEVTFDHPVAFYVENFIGFPVGTPVPVGFYDRQAGVWRPLPDGRVIKILSVSGGVATLDVTGSGNPSGTASLDSLGITTPELQRLATLYAPGETLWRTEHTHFSPVDWNWPGGPPADALPPFLRDLFRRLSDCASQAGGSIIECENQVLGEQIGVTGTPFSLAYRSSRVQGFVPSRERVIPLSGSSLPASLKRIDLEIDVGGQHFAQSFPRQTNHRYRFVWDGLDAYGRRLQGGQPFTAKVGYVYNTTIQRGLPPISFAIPSGFPTTYNAPRAEYTLWQEHHSTIGGMDAYRAAGIGSWTLSAHHFYDPIGHVLHTGDGRQRGVDEIAPTIRRIAGTGAEGFAGQGFAGDGGPATSAKFNWPDHIVAGPDGSIYIADQRNFRVRRITPDGIINTVAGGGDTEEPDRIPATEAFLGFTSGIAVGPDGTLYVANIDHLFKVDSAGIITKVAGRTYTDGIPDGDGGPATEAATSPYSIAVGPDNSVYILEYYSCFVRQVTPDGIIHTIGGNGSCTTSGDGGPAVQAGIANWGYGLAAGPDGSVYLNDDLTRIRRIGPDGIISTVAGNGAPIFSPSIGDGGPATSAQFGCITNVAVAPDQSVLVTDQCSNRLRRVTPDGIIRNVAGRGNIGGPLGDGGPAAAAWFFNIWSVAVMPDGRVITSDDETVSIREIRPVMPGIGVGTILVASEGGSELYEFTTTGEHLRTLNALTGATLLTFGYNASGSLHTITDANGDVTTIERNGQDRPTAIVGPDGQRTVIGLDPAGHLASLTNPAGEVVRLFHRATGLLDSLLDPRGKPHRFEYDSVGRLIRDRDGAGGDQTLVRTETDTGYTVVRSTALGRQTTYTYHELPTGARRKVRTEPSGHSTVTILGIDASSRTTSPDATVVTIARRGDPRWGMQAPQAQVDTVRLPSGLTSILRTASVATLTNANDPLSLVSLADSVVLNNKAVVTTYVAAQRRLTATTPEGRQVITRTDSVGRVLSERTVGLDSVSYQYNARGRLGEMRSGGRIWTYSYDGLNRLLSTLDPLVRRDSLFYDAADRLTRQVLPSGREVRFAYDSSGNLTSVTPPTRPAHGFGYNAVDQTTSYTPPNVGLTTPGTSYSYNGDRQLTQITRPDSVTIGFGYEAATGRLSTISFDRGLVALGYSSTTGQLTSLTAPGSATLAYTYDGRLPKTVTWGGPVTGSMGVGYNTDFRVTSQTVNGANSLTFGYDRDGLLTAAGALGIKRHAQHGLVERDSLNTVKGAWSYTSRAALAGYTATSGATTLFQTASTRDSLDRIASVTETIGGSTTTSAFTYDSAGRLSEVRRDGVLTAAYEYDANGNRTRLTTPGGAIIGTYDDQDRLTSYGITTYSYGSNGELKTRTEPGVGTTSYSYDALENLVAATLPDGTAIAYVIDGQNRRIGKKVNGTLVQGFLYQGQLAPVAELGGSNQVVSRFVYGTRSNVPDYMVKAGVTYRIIADHLGSVRLVVNAGTGAIAQRIDYNEFGRVTQNTAPGFQPFGFAGGILDSHTGLTRLGARDYEATTGRWVAKDPLGFGGGYSNLYEYVDNDPINAIDPTGLQGFGVVVGGSVGVSAPTPYSPYGVTGTGSAGVGIFVGSGVGAFIEGGAYAGGPTGGYGAPGGVTSGDGYFVSGDYVGAGGGFFLTNAENAHALGGDFETWQYNTPFVSFEYSFSKGTWIAALTWGPGGPLASLSRFRTRTPWTWDCVR